MTDWPAGPPVARFACPVAPSVNNLFVNAGRARVRSATYKAWQEKAGWTVKLQHPPAVPGPVAVHIEAPINRRRDLDNVSKAVLDLIVMLGIISDDRQIDDLRITRQFIGDSMTVSIWSLAKTIAEALPSRGQRAV